MANPTTLQITPTHHSDALQSHPLLQLMYSADTPNATLTPILIPEPSPHLKVFAVASMSITPYSFLSISPAKSVIEYR